MHVLYLHQQFQTRASFTGNRSYEFSRILTARGHRVTMICSGVETEPQLTVPKGKNHIETEIDSIHCVPIAAAWANPLKITGIPGHRRMAGFLNFARLATKVGKQLSKPDVVFATHTPLTIGLAGMRLARHFQVPFVFEVRDLWPQALINLGALKNPLIIGWLRRMEHRIYDASDHIVALSPGIRKGVLDTNYPEDQITLIPNASDTELFHPEVDGSQVRARFGLQDKFVAMYFGGMGMANGLEYVLEAARCLKMCGNDQIKIVFVGDGGTRTELQRMADAHGLDNVLFVDPVPKAQMPEMVAACDVSLVIFRAMKETTWSPNKMFDSLSAGKPVITNAAGWLTEIVDENYCGCGVDAAEPRQLADRLVEFAERDSLLMQMSKNARIVAESSFARDKLASELEKVLTDVVAQARPQPHEIAVNA